MAEGASRQSATVLERLDAHLPARLLGFGLIYAWGICLWDIPLPASAHANALQTDPAWFLSALLTPLACLVIALIGRQRELSSLPGVTVAAPLLCSIGSIALIGCGYTSGWVHGLCTLVAGAGTGLGPAFLVILWGCLFARISTSIVETMIPASFVATLLGALVVPELPPLPAAPAPKAAAPPPPKKGMTWGRGGAAGLVLLLIPLTLFLGHAYLGERKYYFLSLLLLLEGMLPFFLLFEGRRPRARELVLLASLCALGVAGRAAFFMLPQCKPVMALTILSGAAFGGETGFLVGSVTMLASNALFGQGPMTPWQMFAMGLTGFFAGFLFRKGLLRRSRGGLAVYGILAALLLYGAPLNIASALLWLDEVNGKILLGYCLTGLPMDAVQAAATCFFLWFGAEPFLEKLERIQIKYGLLA